MSDVPDSTTTALNHPLGNNGTANQSTVNSMSHGTENLHNNDDDKITSSRGKGGGGSGDGAPGKKNWIKFENDDEQPSSSSNETHKDVGGRPAQAHPLESSMNAAKKIEESAPAVLPTESVHVTIDGMSPKPMSSSKMTASPRSSPRPSNDINKTSQPAVIEVPPSSGNGLRTIELSSGRVREGFSNGDIIVTLLPTNQKLPWVTPAKFRPELVPEELMAQGLTLTVEDYVQAMETLVNDFRFTMYNICYKRVLVCWIMFAFFVLMGILFSGLTGITLFSLGVAWLFLNAMAIFVCMFVKLRLARGLERCMARVNKQLIRHKILLALDDRGNISCHKVNLCFLYFEPTQCIKHINEFIERNEQAGTVIEAGWESRLDVAADDIVIQGSNPTRVSRKQERGLLLLLRYAHRWGNEAMRGFIDVTSVDPARHCTSYQCPCQYIERHLQCKPRGAYFAPKTESTVPSTDDLIWDATHLRPE